MKRIKKILLRICPCLQKYEDNYNFMREELDKIGKLFEKKSYEELQRSAEELSFEKTIEGHKLTFSAEAYEVKKNGDLAFSIDVNGLPTLGAKPSYHFYKRKDDSVYY